MFILENVPLSGYSTMRLGGNAAYLTEVNSRSDVTQAAAWAEERNLPIITIGIGSNIIWRDEGFAGLVLVNKIPGFSVEEFDPDTHYVTIGAGENWDSAVARTVELGLSGIERLSLIPGTAGAAPVQNIGAYGSQLADTLITVEVYDLQEKKWGMLRASECELAYRTSRFKHADRGRFIITGITLQLSKQINNDQLYASLQSYLDKNGIIERNVQIFRDAVIAIRQAKLPDPTFVANNGSFFQNPIIPKYQLSQILEEYPRLAQWPTKLMWEMPDGMVKVAAGALLEHEGFKDYHDEQTGMATWKDQALVLVNEKASSTQDLITFRDMITSRIADKFHITLAQEPELLP